MSKILELPPPLPAASATATTMADDIKETKKKIWGVKQQIKQQEKDRAGWAEQLPSAVSTVEALPPGDDRDLYAGFVKEINHNIAVHDAEITKLQDEIAALEAILPKEPEPAAPKFDPEKHPLLRKALEKAEPEKPVVFNVGDICEAQWTKDKGWYKAKIQSVLGSMSAPKYLVKYVDYPESETLDRGAVRPLQNKRKRELESAPTPIPQSAPAINPHVISGPASINPDAQAAKKDLAGENGDQKKRRTIGSSKQLEKRVNNWQSFTSKGPGKKFAKKESMFRSGTAVNSRVGFTGSGAGMTETHKRVRHKNERQLEDDPEGGGVLAPPPKRRY